MLGCPVQYTVSKYVLSLPSRLHEMNTLSSSHAVVLCTNSGVQSLRRPFYRNIEAFLQHVICVATCSRKNKNKAKVKANKKWSYSVPVSFELVRDKLPGVFKKSRPTYECAMETLASTGITKLTGYSNAQNSGREYSVSQPFLRKLFGTDREGYLSREDHYHYLTDIFTKRKSYLFDEVIGIAIDRG